MIVRAIVMFISMVPEISPPILSEVVAGEV